MTLILLLYRIFTVYTYYYDITLREKKVLAQPPPKDFLFRFQFENEFSDETYTEIVVYFINGRYIGRIYFCRLPTFLRDQNSYFPHSKLTSFHIVYNIIDSIFTNIKFIIKRKTET